MRTCWIEGHAGGPHITVSPAVSIILPVHNAGGTLHRAVRSILQQSFADLELIIVDDGSTDATAGVISDAARQDARVVVAGGWRVRRGVVAAFNAGLAVARGHHIGRMDADDLSSANRVEAQVQLLESMPEADVATCDIRIVGNVDMPDGAPRDGFLRYEKWLNSLDSPESITAERFVESPVCNPSVLARRAFWAHTSGYRDVDWPEDYDLWLDALHRGVRIVRAGGACLHWQDGARRLTRTDGRYSALNFQRAKAHYLAKLGHVAERGVMVSGAGPTGKSMARLLMAEDVRVHGFVEVNPKQIGGAWRGIPIVGVDEIPDAPASAPVQLGAVGQPGRREAVAKLFEDRGYLRGRDFFAVA